MAFLGGLIKGLGGPGAAIGLGSSLLQGIGGLFQRNKAKKMLARLQDPGYRIPKGFYKNLAESEQMARTGMPMEQYNLAKQGIDRAVSTGMRGLSRSANPSAGVASAVRAGTEGVLNLEAQNAAVRRQNILQAMGARRELAGQELAKQQYNQQRYMERVNQANAMMGAGQQNVAGALGGIANIGMTNMVYGAGKTPSTTSASPMSPTQLAAISSYSAPKLNIGSPASLGSLSQFDENQPMNLGSLNTGGRFSGFGFR